MRSRRKPPLRILGRPRAGMVEAVKAGGKMAWLPLEGTEAIFICTRVGDAEHVPAGYWTTDYHMCGSACWINSDLVDQSEAAGMTVLPLCLQCVKPAGPGD